MVLTTQITMYMHSNSRIQDVTLKCQLRFYSTTLLRKENFRPRFYVWTNDTVLKLTYLSSTSKTVCLVWDSSLHKSHTRYRKVWKCSLPSLYVGTQIWLFGMTNTNSKILTTIPLRLSYEEKIPRFYVRANETDYLLISKVIDQRFCLVWV